MFTLRSLAIVVTGAGVFAAFPLSHVQACDNDRYPCPVVLEAAPQDTADTAVTPPPSAQPRKKAERAARQAAPPQITNTVAKPAPSARPPKKEKAQAKVSAAGAANEAKPSKPAVQELVTAPIAQNDEGAAPAVARPVSTDQDVNSPSAGVVAAAGTAWPALPKPDRSSAAEATVEDGAQAAADEVNEIDKAALASTPSESAWITYAVLILGAALAAAAGIRFLPRMTSRFPRRAARA
jgi:hypothetical protein